MLEPEELTAGKDTEFHQALQCRSGHCRTGPLELIGEEPLVIRINDRPYAVVMRTPGDELFHAAGFCLGEGIADTADDFLSIGYCKDLDPNVVDIRLKPERAEQIPDLLERKSFISQTSCGLCGKELLKDLQQIVTPLEDGFSIESSRIFDCITALFKNQNYYPRTKGTHAALIFDDQQKMISFAEDVGRHNALDKAVGNVLMHRLLDRARILVLSSRISYELVQKAARAHLPMMISKSRPTALAAELGQALNMTLVCSSEESELIVVCGRDRILDPGSSPVANGDDAGV